MATAIVAVVAAVIVVGLAVAVVNLLRQLLKELGELIQAVKAKAVRKKTKRGRKVGHHIIAKASIWGRFPREEYGLINYVIILMMGGIWHIFMKDITTICIL